MSSAKLSQRRGKPQPINDPGEFTPRTKKLLGDCGDVFKGLELTPLEGAQLIKSCDYDVDRINLRVCEILDTRTDNTRWETVGKKPAKKETNTTGAWTSVGRSHAPSSQRESSKPAQPKNNFNANSDTTDAPKTTVIKPVPAALPQNSAWSRPMAVAPEAVSGWGSSAPKRTIQTTKVAKAVEAADALAAAASASPATGISMSALLDRAGVPRNAGFPVEDPTEVYPVLGSGPSGSAPVSIWGPPSITKAVQAAEEAEAERARRIARGEDPDAEAKAEAAKRESEEQAAREAAEAAAAAEVARRQQEEAEAVARAAEEARLAAEREREAQLLIEQERALAEAAQAAKLEEELRMRRQQEEEQRALEAARAQAAAAEAEEMRLRELATLPPVSLPGFDDSDIAVDMRPPVSLPMMGMGFADDLPDIVFGAPAATSAPEPVALPVDIEFTHEEPAPVQASVAEPAAPAVPAETPVTPASIPEPVVRETPAVASAAVASPGTASEPVAATASTSGASQPTQPMHPQQHGQNMMAGMVNPLIDYRMPMYPQYPHYGYSNFAPHFNHYSPEYFFGGVHGMAMPTSHEMLLFQQQQQQQHNDFYKNNYAQQQGAAPQAAAAAQPQATQNNAANPTQAHYQQRSNPRAAPVQNMPQQQNGAQAPNAQQNPHHRMNVHQQPYGRDVNAGFGYPQPQYPYSPAGYSQYPSHLYPGQQGSYMPNQGGYY